MTASFPRVLSGPDDGAIASAPTEAERSLLYVELIGGRSNAGPAPPKDCQPIRIDHRLAGLEVDPR